MYQLSRVSLSRVVENSSYYGLSIEQCPSQCCGLSVDDVQQCDSRGSFVFSQSRVQVSACLTDVGSLAVGAFDLVNCSLSVVKLVQTIY